MVNKSGSKPIRVAQLLLKALLLFLIFNILFALLKPVSLLENLSGYNLLYPGRLRLPFGEVPEKAYNLSLYQLDAMFTAHEASAIKPDDEYRIFIIGDSSVWGYLLEPDQTITAVLNQANLTTHTGKQVKFYNLGYPTISLMKDLLILSKAMDYQPDMIIWFTTLEAFPQNKQLASPIVQHNPLKVRELIQSYSLDLDPQDSRFVVPSFWNETIVGQRRALADILHLQLYGTMWAATGIDQYVPESYDPPQSDLEADENFSGLNPPTLQKADLAFDVLTAGIKMVGKRPLLIINEPIYISQGENSNIRYNFFYPRWAFDQYRLLLQKESQQKDWNYLDLWDAVDPKEFTNSAIHISPRGTAQLSVMIIPLVKDLLEK
jgi:hypothetical protein